MTGNAGAIDWSEWKPRRFAFETVGDRAAGTVTGIRVENGQSGRTPVLEIKDGDDRERELWAGSFDLKRQFAELQPEVGDGITVELIELRDTGMPSPMKCYVVTVQKADETPF